MLRTILRLLLAIFFIVAGLMHFLRAPLYVSVMPSYLPWPLALVYISGAAEIAGGIGVLLPFFRRAAAWGLIALLIAVFPANIHMLTHGLTVGSTVVPLWILIVRLPFQLVFIYWVYWTSLKEKC